MGQGAAGAARISQDIAPDHARSTWMSKILSLEPKKKSSWLILGSTEKSESAAWHRCQSKRGMSWESCGLLLWQLCCM